MMMDMAGALLWLNPSTPTASAIGTSASGGEGPTSPPQQTPNVEMFLVEDGKSSRQRRRQQNQPQPTDLSKTFSAPTTHHKKEQHHPQQDQSLRQSSRMPKQPPPRPKHKQQQGRQQQQQATARHSRSPQPKNQTESAKKLNFLDSSFRSHTSTSSRQPRKLPPKLLQELQSRRRPDSDDDDSSVEHPVDATLRFMNEMMPQMPQFFEREEAQVVGLGAAVARRNSGGGTGTGTSFIRKRRQFSKDSLELFDMISYSDCDLNDDSDVTNDGAGKKGMKEKYSESSLRKSKGDKHSIEKMEDKARKRALTNPCVLFFLHMYAATKILVRHLITLESIVGCLLSVGMTCYWYFYHAIHPDHRDGWNGSMSFVLVSFAVVSPITVAIRMAFTRREQALERIASIRSYFQHLYLAHCLWDWKTGTGRKEASAEFDFLRHCDGVLEQLIAMGDELARFLSLPNTSKGINRATSAGRREATRTIQAAYGLLESMTLHRMTKLTVYAERLKAVGLGGSEISRIRAFERHLAERLESLRMLKMYRTPQALWSFARVFSILIPAFYGPTFAQVAYNLNSLEVGITLSICTSLILTALLEAVQVLEDPFTAYVSLDGIDVREEFQVLNWNQLVKARKLMFPAAPEYPLRARPAITGRYYDPFVHHHATPEERQALIQYDMYRIIEMSERDDGDESYEDFVQDETMDDDGGTATDSTTSASGGVYLDPVRDVENQLRLSSHRPSNNHRQGRDGESYNILSKSGQSKRISSSHTKTTSNVVSSSKPKNNRASVWY